MIFHDVAGGVLNCADQNGNFLCGTAKFFYTQ